MYFTTVEVCRTGSLGKQFRYYIEIFLLKHGEYLKGRDSLYEQCLASTVNDREPLVVTSAF